MFTGIVTHNGRLQKITRDTYTFSAPKDYCRKLRTGTSVAINGMCLTVVKKPTGNTFSVELMPETRRRTMLRSLKKGDIANLELPATLKTFLSGHIVQGHIDGVGGIVTIAKDGKSKLVTVKISPLLASSVVRKGSITVNGVSLTVIDVTKDTFTVGIIPYTWNHTMFHTLKVGSFVNIEVDILAKYIKSFLRKGG